ncbi:MAG TPA: alpha/beta fold hydrolase [Solirubrobacteraceae bacterium]|nr:alpha/beta fold hydrolase [Solirubrobacteraceae bacterium]
MTRLASMPRVAPAPWPPEPPFDMPPAQTVRVPGRGEFFLRDTGGQGTPVMLLHGWMASADLNWCGAYGSLTDAGFRVLAIDHRGHGRGLRPLVPFQLVDCAADAAAVLRTLDLPPAVVVGYSMGGAVAQLVARDHPDVASGVVLSGTAQHFQDPRSRRSFWAMGAAGIPLSLAPRVAWRRGLARAGIPENQRTAWVQSELMRHSVSDIVAAGRELGRFDSRSWLSSIDLPFAAVITTRDEAVPVSRQRELAQACRARVFEVPIRHMDIVMRAGQYNPALLEALNTLPTHVAQAA